MPEFQEPESILNDIIGRLRLLENKYSLYGERLLIINRNTLDEFRKVVREIRALQKDILEAKKDIANIKETIKNVIKEMQTFAKKENIMVLEKYINMWNPMNFVTEEEVKKIISEQNAKKRGTARTANK